ncbi:MAG: serine protease [Xanthobacteraceae bacterium]
MRFSIAVVALIAGLLPASTVDSAPKKQAAVPSPRASYAAMPLAERMSAQSDLIWASGYEGPANGEITDRDIAAIRSFQKQNRSRATGVLNPKEREILAAAAEKARDAVGWRLLNDTRSGARVGLPGKIMPQTGQNKSGSRWTSNHGDVVMETFRVKEAGTTLAAVFDQQKKEPVERRVESAVLRPDSFSIYGLQGLKRFYVRGYFQNGEVRGLAVLFDQAVDGTMRPLLPAVWSAFMPFSSIATVATPKIPSATGHVEYGTGIVASAEGHILTPRHLVDGCKVVVVAGLGNADPVADDQTSGLALIRVYGNRDLVPLPLAGEAVPGREFTIVGVADPKTQAGGAAASTARARLDAGGGKSRAIDPVPISGFSGAAAIDGGNGFAGMVQLKPQILAGAEPSDLPAPATIISAEAIRDFLRAQSVQPASGNCEVAQAKASVVRVICVRK